MIHQWDGAKQNLNGLVQECSNSSVLAMELLQYCAEPLWCNSQYISNGVLSFVHTHWHTVYPIKYAHSFDVLIFICGLSSDLIGPVWLIYQYSSGLLHRHWGNRMIAPVPVKEPWRKWVILSYAWPKQNKTQPELFPYFLRCTVWVYTFPLPVGSIAGQVIFAADVGCLFILHGFQTRTISDTMTETTTVGAAILTWKTSVNINNTCTITYNWTLPMATWAVTISVHMRHVILVYTCITGTAILVPYL